jgi:formylglycine-generating enzyme required for sulfatase activity
MGRALVALALLVGCGDAAAPSVDGGPDAQMALDAGPDAPMVLDAAPLDCPSEMVRIGAFCVDRWEGTVVELDADGGARPHSPFDVIADAQVAARSAPGVMPQGYISQVEATDACARAGKRLCTAAEFSLACRGPDAGALYPYGGTVKRDGACNEGKGSSMPLFFGTNPLLWTYAEFNDPRLNEWDGGLAPTGSYPSCVSPYGVADCVGNLHEWGADPPDDAGHGRFRGGFYGDAEVNGHGCAYVTKAHGIRYHDYSTGFRCCKDAP